jgi:hypothetical protein
MVTAYISDGKPEVQIITQQYEIGLYIAFYQGSAFLDQSTSRKPELAYHKHIRKIIEKNGDQVVLENSSFIEPTKTRKKVKTTN